MSVRHHRSDRWLGDYICRSGIRFRLPASQPTSVDETLGMNCRASAGETRGYPGGSDEGVARSGSGLSSVFACNSADSGSREPVLQHAMYYRLYHRSCFAYSGALSFGVSPASYPSGFARQDRRSAPEGCFPANQRSLSHPGNPSGSHLSQASQ